MVKIIDNYVLEREIGKGQFGNVYKSYNKDTGEDLAVKAVCRKKLKGKFYELLENEIKVLKTCKNNNIIRLYDIKKTQNNIYLVLEYCNEGDLMEYLKSKNRLTEDEAVDFFIQIMNAFKTLYKNKIMHRDFKLANILKHNGVIKIADFGFAKLLGNQDLTSTMLGSPLNMAPEVLGGKTYNNKADIWSIGTCFYELIYGKPPYTGKNIADLLNNIKNKPVYFDPRVRLSPIVLDVLKRMLVFDVDKRIDWKDLFCHKILIMQEEKIMDELKETMQKDDILKNMSKFYINNNRVIDHIADIEKKEDINNFAFEIARNNNTKKEEFTGKFVKHNTVRNENINSNPKNKKEITETPDDSKIGKEETIGEKLIKSNKINSSRLLHERNKYVFLASVAEDAISFNFKFSDLLGFLLIKKLFFMISNLKEIVEFKLNKYQLDFWPEYINSKEFSQINSYIIKEYDVFKLYYQSMNDNVLNNYKKSSKKNNLVEQALNISDYKETDQLIKLVIYDYVKNCITIIDQNSRKEVWIHLNQVLDCVEQDKIFRFSVAQNSMYSQFNFKLYYEEIKEQELSKIVQIVKQKYGQYYN